MYSLFVDTSSQNFLALFKDKECLESHIFEHKASMIQLNIHNFLKQYRLEIKDLETIYYGAGPGSYTGMRIVQGLIGTLDIFNFRTKGIYVYEILDKDQLWLSRAFKGEFFIYYNSEKRLCTENEARLFLSNYQGEIFSYKNEQVLDRNVCSIYPLIIKQFHLIHDISGNRAPYYYRPLEVEFKKKSKGN